MRSPVPSSPEAAPRRKVTRVAPPAVGVITQHMLTPAAAPSLRKVARGLIYMAEGLEEMDAVRRRPEQREFAREVKEIAEVEEEEEEEEVRGKGKGKAKARK